MTMRSWQEDGHTKFGQWLKDVSKNQWTLIGIMDFPVPNVAFNYGQMLFQEDWAGNGKDVREARVKNGYGRKSLDNNWISWNTQSIDGQDPLNNNWDGGATSEYLWFKAGGNSQSTIGTGKAFTLNQPSQPEMGKLEYDIQSMYYENEKLNVSWKLKGNSTPQFKGKIEVYNNENMTGQPINIIDNIKPYQSGISQSISLPANAYAKLILTDLFDQTVEKKGEIKNDSNEVPAPPTDLQAMDITENSIGIQWNSSTSNIGIKEYEIYRNGTKIGTSPSTKYTDTGLQANTGYSYIVKAIDKKGNVSTASTEIKVKTKEKESEGTTTWDVNKIYTSGDHILFNGDEYEAMYWTKGDQPDISDVWKLLGDVILEWNAQKAYQGGEKISYQGITYQAKWWTKGDIPGQASVWERLG